MIRMPTDNPVPLTLASVREPEFDNGQASEEGWGIFDSGGSENGPWQLCRCDENQVFQTDNGAWAHVIEKARAGSTYHSTALDFIRAYNAIEWVSFHDYHGEDLVYPDGAPMVGEDGAILQSDGQAYLHGDGQPIMAPWMRADQPAVLAPSVSPSP